MKVMTEMMPMVTPFCFPDQLCGFSGSSGPFQPTMMVGSRGVPFSLPDVSASPDDRPLSSSFGPTAGARVSVSAAGRPSSTLPMVDNVVADDGSHGIEEAGGILLGQELRCELPNWEPCLYRAGDKLRPVSL